MRRLFNGKLLVLLLALAGAYYGYGRFSAPQENAGGMPGGAAPVGVAEVIVREVQQWQEFSGRVVAVESAEIRPQVSGLIEQVHFREGEQVEKDQLLFTIDQRPYRAVLEAAQARFTLAESELRRADKLLKDKAIPQREYDQRRNDMEAAKADLTQASLNYEYTLVKAPVAGRVSRAEITVGNLVDTGNNAPVLTRVVSDRPIYADFDMDERSFLQYLQASGANAEKLKNVQVYLGLSGEDGTPHQGRMQSFDNQLNTNTGTIRARAIFENADGKLLPGLFARVRLGSADKAEAVLISDRAVGTDQNKKFVLAVGADNTVEYRQVALGGMADGLRVVREGLKPGDRIIISGLQRAQPGMPVTPEPVSMEGQDLAGSGMQDAASPSAGGGTDAAPPPVSGEDSGSGIQNSEEKQEMSGDEEKRLDGEPQ